MSTKAPGQPRGRPNVPLNLPEIDELAGYINQERAMATLGITAQPYLRELLVKGSITAVRWDRRTLLYDKRSVEKYRRERAARKAGEGQHQS
jgi:hypothetical protein